MNIAIDAATIFDKMLSLHMNGAPKQPSKPPSEPYRYYACTRSEHLRPSYECKELSRGGYDNAIDIMDVQLVSTWMPKAADKAILSYKLGGSVTLKN